MEINSIQLENAPDKGFMLAYLRDEVLFENYETLNHIKEQLMTRDILELHLFNSDFEYRALSTISKRFPNGIIETIVDFDYSDDIYAVETSLDSKYDIEKTGLKNIKVLNHISYDKNGVAHIDNYRLIPGGDF